MLQCVVTPSLVGVLLALLSFGVMAVENAPDIVLVCYIQSTLLFITN